jgi:hypothetical protein
MQLLVLCAGVEGLILQALQQQSTTNYIECIGTQNPDIYPYLTLAANVLSNLPYFASDW